MKSIIPSAAPLIPLPPRSQCCDWQRTVTNSILITGGGVPKAAIPNRVLDFIGWNTRFLKGFEKIFPMYVARAATSSPIFPMFCSLYFMFFLDFRNAVTALRVGYVAKQMHMCHKRIIVFVGSQTCSSSSTVQLLLCVSVPYWFFYLRSSLHPTKNVLLLLWVLTQLVKSSSVSLWWLTAHVWCQTDCVV